MLILFLVLLIAPIIVRSLNLVKLPTIPFDLMQPLDKNNNNTKEYYTGNSIPAGFGPIMSGSSVPTATS
jgi:1,3-beta-glucan synthase